MAVREEGGWGLGEKGEGTMQGKKPHRDNSMATTEEKGVGDVEGTQGTHGDGRALDLGW